MQCPVLFRIGSKYRRTNEKNAEVVVSGEQDGWRVQGNKDIAVFVRRLAALVDT